MNLSSTKLGEFRGSKAAIIGIGNELRGDDGVGQLVCQLVKGKTGAEVISTGATPENYVYQIISKNPEKLIIIDAMDIGASPGTTRILSSRQLSNQTSSTHTFSPRLLAKTICQIISADPLFVVIQPKQTQLGQSLSACVYQAAQSLAEELIELFPVTGKENGSLP